MTARETHFGFRNVPEDEKARMVRAVFDSVAPRYDLMNDLMSLGIHRLWKAAFVKDLKPRPSMRLLDVGGGTGDIAFRFLELGGREVTVCDINKEMLAVGRDRAIDRGLLKGLTWACGDAEGLPFPDSSFDAFTIAFCIRNVTRIPEALKEARRVLRPGGRFLCLEFSKVVLPVLDKLYDTYSFQVLPALGQLVADDREAYRYLAESIRRFPDQDEFSWMIGEAGLERVTYRNLTGGIAAIHSGWRL
ncbi:MAG: bifunctional demethylmenaquinone methyltransferase/2-methoxy-6-polyprenyl-1,4-benzoquinol methylase UbiE [Magnetospirillum sp. WYHS-4]